MCDENPNANEGAQQSQQTSRWVICDASRLTEELCPEIQSFSSFKSISSLPMTPIENAEYKIAQILWQRRRQRMDKRWPRIWTFRIAQTYTEGPPVNFQRF